MLLYFENNKGIRTLISNPPNVECMWKDINLFLEKRNFKPYYTRINFGKKELVIDVGSHTEFFIIKHFDEEDLEVLKGYKG